MPDGSLPPPPHDSSGHTWHHPDALLLSIIASGGDPATKSKMPAFKDKLTQDEMTAILEFIKSRWGEGERGFQWWMTATTPPTPTPTPVALGRTLFVANCAECHGENAEGHVIEPAPALDASEHAWHHPDWQLRQFIHDGKYSFGPVQMPAFKDKLGDPAGQIGFVIAYIKSLWTEEQRASQESMNQRSVVPTP